MINKISNILTFIIVITTIQSVREERRLRRLLTYVKKIHDDPSPATLEETVAHFWLGQMYAKYGTDKQLDTWYTITHGVTLGLEEDIAECQRSHNKHGL